MQIQQLVTPGLTFCKTEATSKKNLLNLIAERVTEKHQVLEAQTVFDALIGRERLGSTGIGKKVAIPHCRIPGSNSVIALLFTLENPIEFDAIDNQAIQLIFALLVPEESNDTHLTLLSEIATMLSTEKNIQRLLDATSDKNLYFRFQEIIKEVEQLQAES